VELGRGVVERMMVESDVDFTQEVVASKSVTVPDHDAQSPRLQFALHDVVLQTQTHTQKQ